LGEFGYIMETRTIGTIIQETTRKSLRSILDNDKYFIENFSSQARENFDLIIIDSSRFRDIPASLIDENLDLPLLYIHFPGTGLEPTPRHIYQNNFFEIAIPQQESLSSIKTIQQSKEPKHLSDIIKSLEGIRQYIKKSADLFNYVLEENLIEKEIAFTSRGNYGQNKFSAEAVKKIKEIRGPKRAISKVEAVYQAIKIKKLFENPDFQKILQEKNISITEKTKNNIDTLDTKVLVLMGQLPDAVLHELSKREYNIMHLPDIAEGIDKLNKDFFDLVITDIDYFLKEIKDSGEKAVALFSLDQLPDFAYPGAVINIAEDQSVSRYALHSQIKYLISRDDTELRATFSRVLDQALADSKIHAQMEAIPDPLDAIFNESLKAIARGNNSLKITLAQEQLRRIIQERPDRKYPYSNIIRAYAYEELNVISTETIFSLKPGIASTPIILKRYKSKRRAKCELQAYQQNTKHNELLKAKLKDATLSKHERFYWTNTPRINERPLIHHPDLSKDILFIGREYIRGPTLEQLAAELAKRKDKKAEEFKKRTIFEINKLLAWFQINPIKIPEEEPYEYTDFSANFKETLADNLNYLNTHFSREEVSCLRKTSSILMAGLYDFTDTQYFDFNWSNIVFDAGKEDASLDDLLLLADKEGRTIPEFIEERLYKLDFNKIYRKTSKFEDIRHTSTRTKIKEPDRIKYDFHFLLYRKKFALLDKIRDSEELFNLYKNQIEEINKLIYKTENKRLSRPDKARIKGLIEDEKKELVKIDSSIRLYREFRWFDHFFRKYLSRAIKENQEHKIGELEKELNFYCNNAKRHLNRIIRDNKDNISQRIIQKSKHQFMDESNLTKETAKKYTSILEDIKNKTENIQKVRTAQEYVAAKYLLTVFAKIGKLDINYKRIVKGYKDE